MTDQLWSAYNMSASARDIVVQAVYTPIDYTVTFLDKNGVKVDGFTYNVDDYSAAHTPNLPATPLYYVDGSGEWWVLDENGDKLCRWSEYNLFIGDVTVKAFYTPIEYAVTFKDADGNTIATDTYTVEDQTLTFPSLGNYGREHYRIVWVLWDESTDTWAEWNGALPFEDMIFKISYVALEYKVTFYANGELKYTLTYTVEDDSELVDGNGNRVIPAMVQGTTPGYDSTSGQWYVFVDGEKTVLWSAFDYRTYPGNVEVHAVYDIVEYKVSFWANGVEYAYFTYTVEDYTDTHTPTMPNSALIGYLNPGVWYVMSDRNGAYSAGEKLWSEYTLDYGNVTVKAIYPLDVYDVIFEDEAGNLLGSDTYTVEDLDVDVPTLPNRENEGYYVAWYVWDTAANAWVGWSETDLTYGDVTVVRRDLPIEYSVSFEADKKYTGQQNDFYKSFIYTVEDQSQVVTPAVPAPKNGYEIVGWYVCDENGDVTDTRWENYTLSMGVVTVKAVYRAITYTVTFEANGTTLDAYTFTYTIESYPATTPVPVIPSCTAAGYKPTEGAKWYIKGMTTEWNDGYLEEGVYGNITVEARYVPITYTVSFYYKGYQNDRLIGTRAYTVEDRRFALYVPDDRDGYTCAWYTYNQATAEYEEWTYDAWQLSGALGDLNVYAIYTPVNYTATFVVDGQIYDQKTFDVTLSAIPVPTAPAKYGYTFTGWYVDLNGDGVVDTNDVALDQYTIVAGNVTVIATFSKNTYIASYSYGNLIGAVFFDVEHGGFELPIPTKEHYTFDTWYIDMDNSGSITAGDIRLTMQQAATFGLARNSAAQEAMFLLPTGTQMPDGNISLYPAFTANTYSVFFIEDDVVKLIFSYTVEDRQFEVPTITPKTGYTAQWCYKSGDTYLPWSLEMLTGGDVEVYAVYTPITYTATFKADGQVIGTVNFTVEQTELLGIPAVPAKKGYNGVWSAYEIKAEDMTIEAVYALIQYTATFIADGIEIAKVNFTVLDTSIEEPEVPAKEGYTGVWQSYELDAADVVIHAVYTPIDGGDDGEKGGFPWWILILIIVMLLAALIIVILVLKNRSDDDDDTTPPAPVVAPEPELEPEPEEPVVLETVDVETADSLMSDADAIAAIEIVFASRVEGPKGIVNIDAINEAFAAGETVDLDSLKAKKLLAKKTTRYKVLANGHLDKPLTVVADQFSVQAIKMITLTGGHAVQKK